MLVSVNDIDYLTYGFTPTQAITDPVVAAAIAQQSVSLVQGVSPSMITPTSTVTLTATATATASVQISTSVPSVLVSPLYAIVLQTTDTVSAQIGQQCINTCQQIVEVTMTPPTSSTCALELDPAIVQIS